MKPIVVVGSINMDLVSHTKRIPVPGETVIGTSFEMHSGGKGANQAVAVARLEYPSILLGAVGDDIFGSKLRGTLRDYGVDVSYIKTAAEPSGTATIVVDLNGENTIIVTPASNSQVTLSYLERNKKVLRSAGMVLTQLETPVETVMWLADFCAMEQIPLMLDPAPATNLPDALLSKLTWFTPNETEASFYTLDGESTEQTLARLFKLGIAHIILKQGSKGVILATADGAREVVDAFRVNTIDTTAAGDAFNGAFAVSLMRGNSPASSARFAAAAAAISVTRAGAQPSLANQDEVLQLMGSAVANEERAML
jgi:ribokinase